MKATRKLFILAGSPPDTIAALEKLQFKGAITNTYWAPFTPEDAEAAFEKNKSVICALDDYFGKIPSDAIVIQLFPAARPKHSPSPQILYTKDEESVDVQFAKFAEEAGYDIGDHKSNSSSGGNDGPTVKTCAYCRYLTGIVEENERTIYRSENFFVIPTLGQFITGYLLIIPYRHVMSNGELDQEVLDEFQTVLDDVKFILELAYPESKGHILVWENGSGSSGVGKAKDSLVHSHVHIAPSTLTSDSIAEVAKFPFDTIELKDLANYKANSYLLIETPEAGKWAINNDPAVYIPRQFVRQLIAEEYGIEGERWNWRTYPYHEKMRDTLFTIIDALVEYEEQLPERIRKNTSFLFE